MSASFRLARNCWADPMISPVMLGAEGTTG